MAAGAEWHVYPGGSIQDAIDGAGEWDTIYVHAGAYVENADVWKRVTLIGDGADVVTVRAADAWDNVFYVTVDWVNISGFTVTGATQRSGIHLYYVDHCDISDSIASNNRYGITLYRSSSNTLTGTNCSNNSSGIRVSFKQ